MAILQDMLVMPKELHEEIISKAYMARGFGEEESKAAAEVASMATGHGIRTHGGLKALHLDDHMGSKSTPQGCVPGAEIEILPHPYKAVERWNCHKKLGQAVAKAAMERCMALADEYGVGIVSVDDAFHYLWGGGYVMDAAKKGYIAYTNCPAALTEVVPFGGKHPTLGTNPHSWGFPTTEAVGYPIVVDWATSVVAMGRVQQLKREGKKLPPNCAVDIAGKMTQDPEAVHALIPFGAHKGYGLSLIDELYAAFIGGSTPTLRNRFDAPVAAGEKQGCTFFFQCIKPDALGCGFAQGRSQAENVKKVIEDILGHGNDRCLLPGQIEANGAKLCAEHGGLLFSAAEVGELAALAAGVGVAMDAGALKKVQVPDPFAMAMAPKKRDDIRVLLTTCSYQDTPGKHHALLEQSGFEVVRARGPLTEAQMLKLVKENDGFDGFLNGDDRITDAVIDAALAAKRPLKVVAKYGIGLDSIAVDHCTAKDIPVLFTPGVNHTTVAEHAIGLMIGCAKHFWLHLSSTKQGGWKRKTGVELAGKTLGVLGMGRIGKEVITRAKAFGMQVIAFDVWWGEPNVKFATEYGVKKAESMDEVIAACDVLTLHTNLDDTTRSMINKERIATMRNGAIVINTARGGLVDEQAVADACKSGKLYGYGGDVLVHEPMPADHPYNSVDNVLLTPHVGSRTNESVERQACRATTNIVQYLTGGKDFIQANKPRS
eukprot:g3180.t1